MTFTPRKIFPIFSLILMVSLSLSACNLLSSGPNEALTPSAVPSLALTFVRTTATAPAATAVPGPTAQVVPDASLRTFQMVDAQNGWAVSDRMVQRTLDGGKPWHNVTPREVPAEIDPDFQVTAVSP